MHVRIQVPMEPADSAYVRQQHQNIELNEAFLLLT